MEQRSHSVYRRSCGGPIKGSTTSDAKVSFPGLEEEVLPHDWHLGRAFANSLAAMANTPHTLAGVDGEMPDLADLLGEGEAPRTPRALGFVHD